MNMQALFATAAAALLAGSAAQATVVFDDYVPGVSWNVDWGSVNSTNVKSGTQSIQGDAGNSQIVFLPPSTPLTIGSEPTLDFWLNTTTNAAVSLDIRISTPAKTVEYHWNGGDTYSVDGVTQVGGLTSDADSSTWQHVKFDVTQVYDYNWPPEYTSLTSTDQISKIQINATATTLVDAVQMVGVPEPTSLGLIGTGALLALRRRRA